MDSNRDSTDWRNSLDLAERASREGRQSRAESLYKDAVAIGTRLGDQNHVTSLIHLADFYSSCQLYELAEPLFRQAILIYERAFGAESFIWAMCLRSLSEVLQAQGKSLEAESIKSKAMKILGRLS